MAQAVSRRLLTAEALIVFRRDGICGGRSSSKFFCLFFFSSEHLGFPCLYRSTYAPYFFCPLWDGQWSHQNPRFCTDTVTPQSKNLKEGDSQALHVALERSFIQKVVYIGCPNKQLPVSAVMYARVPYPKHAVGIFACACFFFVSNMNQSMTQGAENVHLDRNKSQMAGAQRGGSRVARPPRVAELKGQQIGRQNEYFR